VCSDRRRLAAGLAIAAFLRCGGEGAAAAAPRPAAVAVFPIENLSGGAIAAGEIRTFLAGTLAADGVRVLDDAVLEQFFERHRVRDTSGIDAPTAEALRAETGVQGILVASVEQAGTSLPPKFAVVARLVALDAAPAVVWADDVAMSGDDAPGLFDLGLVSDYDTLQSRGLARLGGSLGAYVKTGQAPAPRADAKFRPGAVYRGLALDPKRTYSVAVMPFVNLTDRGGAGEILALLFVRHLSAFAGLQVLDPGVVRRQLLDARIILEGGLSFSDADTVGALSGADFVIGGRVLRYDGSAGYGSDVRVEFSTVLIERSSRRVVWSSDSHNDAREDVGLFGRGASKTAHVMATQMVRLTAVSMAGRAR
jgi:TolB-like protein